MFVFSSLILLDNIGFSPNGSTLSCTDTAGVASAAAMPACPVYPHAKTGLWHTTKPEGNKNIKWERLVLLLIHYFSSIDFPQLSPFSSKGSGKTSSMSYLLSKPATSPPGSKVEQGLAELSERPEGQVFTKGETQRKFEKVWGWR